MTIETRDASRTRDDLSTASLFVTTQRKLAPDSNGNFTKESVYWYGYNSDNLETRTTKTRRGCGRISKTVGNEWKRISKKAAAEILGKYGFTLEQFCAYENGELEIVEVTTDSEEIISTPLVSVDAQDAAVDGEYANCARASRLAFAAMAPSVNAELKKVIAEENEMHRKAEIATKPIIISFTEYNTLLLWAEKISNGQHDAASPLKAYIEKTFNGKVDVAELIEVIIADDLNGFRRFLTQFPFMVRDDAGYLHKLYIYEDGRVVLDEMPR